MKPSSFVREIPITDVPGLRIGHAENEEAKTGVTVLIFDQGATAGVDDQRRRTCLTGNAPGLSCHRG